MKLIKLELQNFKGIKQFELKTNGKNVVIRGDNATGKTTIADALSWLLFGKDSMNRTSFGLKTIDADGNEIHNLDHIVSGTFEIEGEQVELTRSFKEVWKKKRGNPTPEFSGHTTDYYIDGVPAKEKEYKAYVGSIANDKVFQLLANPLHFNENMKWDERRTLLIDMFGNVNDSDILASNSKFEKLVTAIGKNSVDDYNKKIKAEKREINSELDKISIRIDEAHNSIINIDIDESEIENNIIIVKKSIDELNDKIAAEKTAGDNSKLIREKAKLEEDLKDKEIYYQKLREIDIKKWYDKVSDTIKQVGDCTKNIKRLEDNIKTCESDVKYSDERMNALREEYNALPTAPVFDSNICPTCGQELPADVVEQQKEKALSEFNLKRSNEVERINARGIAMKEAKEKSLQLIEEYNKQKIELEEKLKELETQKVEYSDNLDKIKAIPTFNTTDERLSYQRKINALESEILNFSKNDNKIVGELLKQKSEFETQLNDLLAKKAQIEQAKAMQSRISELAEQQSVLSARYDELEQLTYAIEKFTKAKVNALEKLINSNFEITTFKLFDPLINGGIEETCEAMADNVPYTALNNAMRINVGLDIINTLSEKLGVSVPIFVDNAEAITKFIETKQQTIKLIVDENCKELVVEV